MANFVSDAIVSQVVDDMQSIFENGDLHSQSSIREIAVHARDALADREVQSSRNSLFLMIAKRSLAAWHETIHQTKHGR